MLHANQFLLPLHWVVKMKCAYYVIAQSAGAVEYTACFSAEG